MSSWTPGSENDIKAAIKEKPDGEHCGVCNKVNDHADDCGWWYMTHQGEYVPACTTCMPFFWGER